MNAAIRAAGMCLCLYSAGASAQAGMWGQLDARFGNGGEAFVDTGGTDYSDRGAVDSHQRLLIAASKPAMLPDSGEIYVSRFTPDGQPDPDFGTAGIATLPPPVAASVQARGLALTDDDGVYVLYQYQYNDPDLERFMRLCKLTNAGQLDAGFGAKEDDGCIGVIFSLDHNGDFVLDMRVQTNGKVLVLGNRNDITDPGLVAVLNRFNDDGTVDPCFGDAGCTTGGLIYLHGADLSLGESSGSAASLALAPDDRIVVGFDFYTVGDDDLGAFRLQSTGDVDSQFGSNGVVSYAVNLGGGNDDFVHKVLVRPNGHVVIVGESDNSTGTAASAVEFDAAGVLDPDFGSGGVAVTYLDEVALTQFVQSAALDANGRVLIAGNPFDAGYGYTAAVSRLLVDGTEDPTWGFSGRIVVPFAATDDSVDGVFAFGDSVVLSGNTYQKDFNVDLAAVWLESGIFRDGVEGQ